LIFETNIHQNIFPPNNEDIINWTKTISTEMWVPQSLDVNHTSH
jgi:hypothetical protein